MIKQGKYGQFIKGFLTFIDFIILNVVYLIICLFYDTSNAFFSKQIWLVLNFSYLLVVSFFNDIHNKRIVFADKVVLHAIKYVSIFALVFLSLLTFIEKNNIDPITDIILFTSLMLAYSVSWIVERKILKRYRTLGFNFKKIIIIGEGKLGIKLLNEMMSDSGYGYKVLGFFDNKNKSSYAHCYKGKLSDVEEFAIENSIDEMYCAINGENDKEIGDLIKIAEKNAIDFYYVPQINNKFFRRFELYSIGDIPTLSLRPNPLNLVINKVAKRTFDIVFSSIFLIFSPLIFIPVAIAIKLSSPGPIFFKQKRTGYRGDPFMCYKFRTMRVNNESDKLQATKNDPRKTKLGNFLRKTSIDELPQFINVLKGEMSIVGPRPHMLKHTEQYCKLIDNYMLRHIITPGITGWAQVNGYRGQTEELWQMEKRVQYDVWYAENWNILLDLKIIFLTVYNAIRGEKNAF